MVVISVHGCIGYNNTSYDRAMDMPRKPVVRELNPHLVCSLCSGYFIDAATLVDCFHSFCRGCIIPHLLKKKCCPVCRVQITEATLPNCLRTDATLQSLVYKIVPSVYTSELQRRRQLTSASASPAVEPEPTGASNFGLGLGYYSPDDSISLSLEYHEEHADDERKQPVHMRYLKCPAAVSINHLKKFIRRKYGLTDEHNVDVIYENECLAEAFTLMDVAYTFKWDKTAPMRFSYRIYQRTCHILQSASMASNAIETKSSTEKSIASTSSTTVPPAASPTSNDEPPTKKLRGVDASKSERKIECEPVEASTSSSKTLADKKTAKNVRVKSAQRTVEAEEKLLPRECKNSDAVVKSVSQDTNQKVDEKREPTDVVAKKDGSNKRSLPESDVVPKKDGSNKRPLPESEVVAKKEGSNKRPLPESDVVTKKEGSNKRSLPESEVPVAENSNYSKKSKDEKEHIARKKGKHKYVFLKGLDDKKRPIIVAPTILHNPDDVMKLKVKLTPVQNAPNTQSNHHHHKHHHHAKHHHNKHHKSDHSPASLSPSTNKEKLLQMRAVRHKTNKQPRAEKSIEEIFQKQKASLLVPPSSITVSKVTPKDKRSADVNKSMVSSNGGMDFKRPSLEIMLVTGKKSSPGSQMSSKNDEIAQRNSESSTKSSKPIIPPKGLTITPKMPTKDSKMVMQTYRATPPKVSISMKPKKPEVSKSPKVRTPKIVTPPSPRTLTPFDLQLTENKDRSSLPAMSDIIAARHDHFGALDLSEKSSRNSDNSTTSSSLESPGDSTRDTSPSLMVAPSLYHAKMISSPADVKREKSSPNTFLHTIPVTSENTVSSINNLKTLSDAAVRIRNLMDIETSAPEQHIANMLAKKVCETLENKHIASAPSVSPSTNHVNNNNNNNNKSNNNNNNIHNKVNNNEKGSPHNGGDLMIDTSVRVSSTPPYPPGSTLRIPVPRPTLKFPTNRGIPRLNEIVSRGRAMPKVGGQQTKPGPNLGVRHIPNPSALFRQQSMNKTTANKPLLVYNGGSNGTSGTTGVAPTASSLTVTTAPIRKMENMARNIEKVAAGLTVRAVEANSAK